MKQPGQNSTVGAKMWYSNLVICRCHIKKVTRTVTSGAVTSILFTRLTNLVRLEYAYGIFLVLWFIIDFGPFTPCTDFPEAFILLLGSIWFLLHPSQNISIYRLPRFTFDYSSYSKNLWKYYLFCYDTFWDGGSTCMVHDSILNVPD